MAAFELREVICVMKSGVTLYEGSNLYIQNESKVIMKLNLTVPMNVVIFLRVQTKAEPLIFCIYHI